VTLRYQLIAAFAAATLVPVALTWWTSVELLEQSLRLAPNAELDQLSQSVQRTGRELYQARRAQLEAGIREGTRAAAERVPPARFDDFWSSGQPEHCGLSEAGTDVECLRREANHVAVYRLPLGVNLRELSAQYTQARGTLDAARERDLRRGFTYTFALLSTGIWVAALAALIWWAHRFSRPVEQLTGALHAVGRGDYSRRIPGRRADEIGLAIDAFNEMAEQVEHSREKLVHVTRLASWQTVARKMAHEVKNSLTPIRLTMEEIAARYDRDRFVEQASQIVVEEVTSLERRVRAFSELASEPPVKLESLNLEALIDERIALLQAAHPGVQYERRLDQSGPVEADADLVRGVLTNLLENAAQAMGEAGVVRVATLVHNGSVWTEIHDSGPGLSESARAALFEPTISFKKGGMGLGLSIARRSALLCGGELELIESELGGAAFRLQLPRASKS
jgi:nitrogen fixation/metabolism regulation signal transduction histidine kinase